jgi:hypothetical protein
LHWYKLRLMREEMRRSQDYAMAVALRIDRTILWSTLVGGGIGIWPRMVHGCWVVDVMLLGGGELVC